MRDQYTLEDPVDIIRLNNAWEQVLKRLAADIAPAMMERFIKPLSPSGLSDGVATVVAPGRFIQEWVRERHQTTLQSLLGDELGEPVRLELVAETRAKPDVPDAVADFAISATVVPEGFRPFERYSFDSFVVGQSNRLAYAGAKAVASVPGKKYNPLFIYGASGLGKTHLLHAIAREILGGDARYPLVYVSAQQFAEEFVNALQNNRIEQFRRAQRSVGVWLVDDIQFIAGKDKTQEEVFHTFNYLHSLGKQIVLSSDRPPRDLYLMDERLRSRFEAGLVADIQMPDTETRCAILRSKASQEGVELDVETAMFLAENVPGNIRVLEGAMTKLACTASIASSPITMDLAALMVEQHYRKSTLAKPSVDQIVEAVGKHFRVSAEEIKGASRKAPIVHARHIAIYITRQLTGDSWKHIGSNFGSRDHTSMMHGYQKVNEMMHHDRDLDSTIKMLMRNLYPEA